MTVEQINISPRRVTEIDGAVLDVFDLPVDEASLRELLHDLFENHWREITFGPIVQGAAWEIKAPSAPTHIGVLDGYLTVAFGATHFHVCIGPTKGMPRNPTSESLARHRRTARAELYRQLGDAGAPMSWGVRLFNGAGEQQMTILLPNPFLDSETGKPLREPVWSHLALWDGLRAHWFGLADPDPLDRQGRRFRHG
jgi:hypothetical protein